MKVKGLKPGFLSIEREAQLRLVLLHRNKRITFPIATTKRSTTTKTERAKATIKVKKAVSNLTPEQKAEILKILEQK